MGDFPKSSEIEIHLTHEEISASREKFDQILGKGKQAIMVSALGSNNNKTYPLNYLSQLMDIAFETTKLPLILNYRPDQENQIDKLIDHLKPSTQKAVMKLEVMGDVKEATETGDGPVDAIFKCIKELYPHEMKLLLYQVHAVTEGTDAQATVSVKIEENNRTTVGQSADTDTLVASANAYLGALNKMLIKREKTAPSQNIKHQRVKGI